MIYSDAVHELYVDMSIYGVRCFSLRGCVPEMIYLIILSLLDARLHCIYRLPCRRYSCIEHGRIPLFPGYSDLANYGTLTVYPVASSMDLHIHYNNHQTPIGGPIQRVSCIRNHGLRPTLSLRKSSSTMDLRYLYL